MRWDILTPISKGLDTFISKIPLLEKFLQITVSSKLFFLYEKEK
jgi:hypothetical protein